MPSIFSKIVAGEIPCHRVWEDEEHLAFLDIQPLSTGHTLVIPKREEDYLFDLSEHRAQALWRSAHQVAQVLKSKLGCARVAVLVLGYEVAHAHIHLIPCETEAAVLSPQRQATDHEALALLAAQLRGDQEVSPLLNTEELESRWDDFATRFVTQVEHTSLKVACAAIEHLQLTGVGSVLEVGCGGGAAGGELRKRLAQRSPTAELVLTDLSQEMLRITETRLQSEVESSSVQTRIERADAQDLPYADASYDRYFSCLNLMLLPDPRAALTEAYRVLKPDGLGVWVVWGRPEYSAMMSLLPKTLKQLGINMPVPARSNFHLGGADTLIELAKFVGFTKCRRWYQPMHTELERGEDFAEMTLNLRPELKDLVGTEQIKELRARLASNAQAHLDEGEAIGLDTLILVARK